MRLFLVVPPRAAHRMAAAQAQVLTMQACGYLPGNKTATTRSLIRCARSRQTRASMLVSFSMEIRPDVTQAPLLKAEAVSLSDHLSCYIVSEWFCEALCQ